MDFNRLYSDHQILLMHADRAPTPALRYVHEVAATHLAGRIGKLQRTLGASAAPGWETLAVPTADSLALPGRHAERYAS